jgi:hypothetical protein
MPRSRRKKILWTAQELRLLRKLAGRHPVDQIASRLKRTVLAVRYRACVTGVSLAYTYKRSR